MSLAEVMVVVGIVSGLSSTTDFRGAQLQANSVACTQQLRAVATALQMFANAEGKLPDAAFYPKGDPKTDPKSIVVLLKGYVDPKGFICPSAPESLKQKGLTFVWNQAASGKDPAALDPKTWLMIEINAVSAKFPPPHLGKYHVLCADFNVREVDKVPEDLAKLVKDLPIGEKAK